MGRDKAKMRLNGRTLLALIRAAAKETDFPVRTIRKDAVERCGPLGGVFTALKSTEAEAVLFLACDMPFITSLFLNRVLRQFTSKTNALFTQSEDRAGFPFILRRKLLPEIEAQIQSKRFSLNALAEKVNADLLSPTTREVAFLLNINTPEEWKNAEELVGKSVKNPSA